MSVEATSFWHVIERGKLLLLRCKNCGAYQSAPRAHCSSCWARDIASEEASGRGAIHTFTVVHCATDTTLQGLKPYIDVLVDLDEGPRLTSHLINSTPNSVHVGMRVKLRDSRLIGEKTLPLFEPEAL
jgi:uncharacterized protein